MVNLSRGREVSGRGREISGLHGVLSLFQGAILRLVRLYGLSVVPEVMKMQISEQGIRFVDIAIFFSVASLGARFL